MNRVERPRPILLLTLLLVISVACPTLAQHFVPVSPATVQWGHFDADARPVLTVKPNEVVTIDTICGVPEMLERLGAPTDAPIREMKEMYLKVKDRGPGPHFLTGPIAIDAAQPGDVLEVEILEIRLRSPYAWMMFQPDGGVLPKEFPYSREKLVHLDMQRNVADFATGVSIPIHPFFGAFGVAPPSGRLSSGPPAYNGGNMDNRWLVAGTKVYFPVYVRGALFSVGDGHAAQGDGEVSGTALETNLTGVFRFTVRKNQHLRWPRAETPTQFITMGLSKDLDEAAHNATREMVDFLTTERGLSRDDAYLLSSGAVDLHITQLVDGVKGVHATLPKAILGPMR